MTIDRPRVRRRRILLPGLLVALAVVACEGDEVGIHPPPVRIAIVQDGSVADAIELVSSTALGADLALRQAVARGELPAGSSIVVLETGGVDAEAVAVEARALAGDPTVVAAFITPFVDAPQAERAFLEAGVPVLSFSGLGGVPGAPGWSRVATTLEDEAAELARVAGAGACFSGASPPGEPYRAWLLAAGLRQVDAGTTGAEAGCGAIVWLGDAEGALQLLASRGDADPVAPALAVPLGARSARLAADGFPQAVGTVAVGPCLDVGTSTAEAARRFVHASQAATGVPPGPCGAEANAAAAWLLEASDGRRAAAWTAVDSLQALETPSATIRFDERGERREPPFLERVVGVRWLPG